MIKIPCKLDHNYECLTCDCSLEYCAFDRWLLEDYKYENKEILDEVFVGLDKNNFKEYIKTLNIIQFNGK